VERHKHWIEGPDASAQAIGLKPILSGVKPEDEGLYVTHHQHWVDEMLKAVETERDRFISIAAKGASA
jgi:benzoate/toluate 1,2-dioxygenase alpha subunit